MYSNSLPLVVLSFLPALLLPPLAEGQEQKVEESDVEVLEQAVDSMAALRR